MRRVGLVLAALCAGAKATCPRSCGGHGDCTRSSKCECHSRWLPPDCTKRCVCQCGTFPFPPSLLAARLATTRSCGFSHSILRNDAAGAWLAAGATGAVPPRRECPFGLSWTPGGTGLTPAGGGLGGQHKYTEVRSTRLHPKRSAAINSADSSLWTLSAQRRAPKSLHRRPHSSHARTLVLLCAAVLLQGDLRP